MYESNYLLDWKDWIFPYMGVALATVGVLYSWRRRKQLIFWYLLSAISWVANWSFGELSLMIIERSTYGSLSYETWIVPALAQGTFRIAMVVFLLIALWKSATWTKREWSFYRAFGTPYFLDRSDSDYSATKLTVEGRLQWLARWLDHLYQFQNSLLHEISQSSVSSTLEIDSVEMCANMLESDKELQLVRNWVAQAKGRFWRAHNVARDFSFQVHPSYKDYLPEITGKSNPTSRRVKRTARNSTPAGGE